MAINTPRVRLSNRAAKAIPNMIADWLRRYKLVNLFIAGLYTFVFPLPTLMCVPNPRCRVAHEYEHVTPVSEAVL